MDSLDIKQIDRDRYFIFLQHRRAINLQTNIYKILQTSGNVRREGKRTREILSKLLFVET